MDLQKSIYIADDEKNIREAIKTFLENDGYQVTAFENGDLLMEAFLTQPADLIILDVMMPGSNGFTICRKLREISRAPIIMLTARDSDLDYVTGLDLGSDDYFTKPFSTISLVMRVKSIFRRIEFDKQEYLFNAEQAELSFLDIAVSLATKTVIVNGKPIDLTPKEFSLICYLIEHQDKTVSKEEIISNVLGFDSDNGMDMVDVAVRQLRSKLNESSVRLDTVWGVGFKLRAMEKDADANEKI